MTFWDTMSMALGAITNNKLRALLTSLGIIIGVGSVIVMIHMGQAASQSVTQSISELGSDMLIIKRGRSKRGADGRYVHAPRFQPEDIEAIRTGISGVRVTPVGMATRLMVNGSASRIATVNGTDNDYLLIRNWEVSAGRTFDPAEVAAGDSVCIVGQTVVEELYADQEPLGSSLRIGRTACSIVGVLEEKGDDIGGDQDDIVLMPFNALRRRITGSRDVEVIFAAAVVSEDTPRIKRSIQELLRARRGVEDGDPDNFRVDDLQQIVETLEQVTATLTALLGAIAAISLLVGGIGIMNIMLVSVTERTREIGVRLAIGATARDVQFQFLVEASVLSAIGGFIGIALGVGITYAVTRTLGLPLVLSPAAIGISFGFSALIGVVFGYVPARKAARLNPIEALRHE